MNHRLEMCSFCIDSYLISPHHPRTRVIPLHSLSYNAFEQTLNDVLTVLKLTVKRHEARVQLIT